MSSSIRATTFGSWGNLDATSTAAGGLHGTANGHDAVHALRGASNIDDHAGKGRGRLN
jgi:hypothetical protein